MFEDNPGDGLLPNYHFHSGTALKFESIKQFCINLAAGKCSQLQHSKSRMQLHWNMQIRFAVLMKEVGQWQGNSAVLSCILARNKWDSMKSDTRSLWTLTVANGIPFSVLYQPVVPLDWKGIAYTTNCNSLSVLPPFESKLWKQKMVRQCHFWGTWYYQNHSIMLSGNRMWCGIER